jgi:hypothetical protein
MEELMIIDMHVHTSISSRCSNLTPMELLERAMELGLDAVCVTEHFTYKGAQVMYEIALDRGFKIFRGMEVYTELGDMLVFGWHDHIRYYLFPFQDLRGKVEKAGGIIIPAHPCRGWDVRHPHRHSLPEELLSSIVALETHNGASTRRSNAQADEIRKKYGLFGVGGSDAHSVNQLGKCVTVFEDDFESEGELIEALRSGRYHAAYLEEIQ